MFLIFLMLAVAADSVASKDRTALRELFKMYWDYIDKDEEAALRTYLVLADLWQEHGDSMRFEGGIGLLPGFELVDDLPLPEPVAFFFQNARWSFIPSVDADLMIWTADEVEDWRFEER